MHLYPLPTIRPLTAHSSKQVLHRTNQESILSLNRALCKNESVETYQHGTQVVKITKRGNSVLLKCGRLVESLSRYNLHGVTCITVDHFDAFEDSSVLSQCARLRHFHVQENSDVPVKYLPRALETLHVAYVEARCFEALKNATVINVLNVIDTATIMCPDSVQKLRIENCNPSAVVRLGKRMQCATFSVMPHCIDICACEEQVVWVLVKSTNIPNIVNTGTYEMSTTYEHEWTRIQFKRHDRKRKRRDSSEL